MRSGMFKYHGTEEPLYSVDKLSVVRCATHPFALRSGPETVNPSVTTRLSPPGGVMSLVAWFRLPRARPTQWMLCRRGRVSLP